MKKLILLAALMAAMTLGAADMPLAQAFCTQSNLLLSATTNATGTAVWVEQNLYHTIHIVSPTNFGTVTLQSSLDNSNWLGFSTNNLEAVATTEITATGKWSYFRATLAGMTNSGTFTVKYLGGR